MSALLEKTWTLLGSTSKRFLIIHMWGKASLISVQVFEDLCLLPWLEGLNFQRFVDGVLTANVCANLSQGT